MGRFAKRASEGDGGVEGRGGSVDASFIASYPALYEYLTLERHDDGKRRQTSTLLLFVDEGTLKACVNDRDNGRVAFFTGAGLEELLRAAESALCDDSADWRRSGKRK